MFRQRPTAPPRSSPPLLTPASEATTWSSCEIAMDRRPHFFKVFFPCYSSKRLVIPPAFWKHIELETSGCVCLKGPSGNVWNVDLVMDKDGSMAFQNGWADFVLDHSLRTGDFLVFRYDGDLLLTVLVFDPTACEKEGAFHVTACQEQEVTILGESHLTRRARKGLEDDLIIIDAKEDIAFHSKSMAWTKKPLVAYQAFPEEHTCSVEILSEERPRVDDGSLIANDANLDCCSDHEAEESSIPDESLRSCRKRFRGKTQKPSRLQAVKRSEHKKKSVTEQPCREIPRTSASLNIDRSKMKVCRGTVESCRRAITEHEKAKTLEAALIFQSKHPFGLSVMRQSYVYYGFYMCLPCSFIKHLPKFSTEMKLWDPCNKPWKVRYLYTEGKGAFSGGWREFSRAHNLESDDVCVFEVLKPCEVRVHIFRVVEETALLRWNNCSKKR